MDAPIAAVPSLDREAAHQRLRLRRFLLAASFSALYLVVLAVFHTQDKVDSATLAAACALVAVAILAFFVLFRLRLNLRFGDPSLTGAQFLAAVFTMLFVLYRAPDTRLAFAAFFFVALMFGMLRSTGTPLTVLGSIALACFALTAGLRHLNRPDAEMLRLDLLQLVVMAITFPWFVFIGRRVARLRDADRRKDEFLASLAHELRNPLAPIRVGIEILKLTGGERPSETVLPMMERQLQHMTRLLDDLLDVSRIARGKAELRVERVDLAEALQAAVEASRPLLDQMGHDFSVTLPTTPVLVDADPVRLAQIVSNLLNNAAKYTPPGGRVSLSATQAGDAVEISVTDTGVGIRRDSLHVIFEMFTQLGDRSQHAQGGLGIGLSLVKGLVELHGGTIEARSEGPGRGSEFRIRLPSRLARRARPRPAPRAAAPRPGQRIVVVDDNRDAASSLSMLLELLGHEVRTAYDGESAVQLCETFRPQLVLLDLGMPNVDGYETCRRIRSQAWGADMTVMAVTGWGQDDDRRRSTTAGFDGHFVKPLDPSELPNILACAERRTPA